MKGVVYHEVINQNETLNVETYCQLEAEDFQKSRPSLYNRKGVLLLHYNERPLITLIPQERLQH